MSHQFDRVCRLRGTSAFAEGCEFLIRAVSQSHGITAMDICASNMNTECRYRKSIQLPLLEQWAGHDVVAGFREHRLIVMSENSLIDILPVITPAEFNMMTAWGVDYIRRGIPWMITRRGKSFSMWKYKVAD